MINYGQILYLPSRDYIYQISQLFIGSSLDFAENIKPFGFSAFIYSKLKSYFQDVAESFVTGVCLLHSVLQEIKTLLKAIWYFLSGNIALTSMKLACSIEDYNPS